MPTVLQFRRGTTTQNNNFTGTAGELSVDTTLDTVRVHDGSTAGGFALLKETGISSLTLNAQAEIRLGDSDSSNYVGFKSPGTVASNLIFTLPTTDGSSGQALVTDASGNLSFAAAGATITSDTTTNTNFLLYFASTTTGALTAVKQDSGLIYNPSTGSLSSAVFIGNLTGVASTITSQANSATTTAASANTANQIVLRGASGEFSAGIATLTATSARYADLAERYTADSAYDPGTVLIFDGALEVTVSNQDASPKVAGVVSTDPAYLMNSDLQGTLTVALALTGRVPTKVVGPVHKGDMMVSTADGRARAESNPTMGTVIGKALEDFSGTEGTIEVVVGRL